MVSPQKGRVRAAAVAKDWTGWKETRRAVGPLVRGNGDGTGPYVAMQMGLAQLGDRVRGKKTNCRASGAWEIGHGCWTCRRRASRVVSLAHTWACWPWVREGKGDHNLGCLVAQRVNRLAGRSM